MKQTHVILWLWDGWRPIYATAHVNAVVRMLRQYLPDARVLCCTDLDIRPGELLCQAWPLWEDPAGFNPYGRLNCYKRLRMFDALQQRLMGIHEGDYVVSLDIDTVICADLAPMLYKNPDAPFVIVNGAHSKYNGSMWRLTAGRYQNIWSHFDWQKTPKLLQRRRAAGEKLIGSDQAWLSVKIHDAPTWSTPDGLFNFSRHARHAERAQAVMWNFAGTIKPWSPTVKVVAPAVAAQYAKFFYE